MNITEMRKTRFLVNDIDKYMEYAQDAGPDCIAGEQMQAWIYLGKYYILCSGKGYILCTANDEFYNDHLGPLEEWLFEWLEDEKMINVADK